MHLHKLSLLFYILISLCLPFSLTAAEKITNYDITVNINKDSGIEVTETITFKVENDKIRLGIFRNIPTEYNFEGKAVYTPGRVISVKRNGEDENFWVENYGSYITIYTGAQEDSYINYLSHGEHTFEIKWTSLNHIRSFDGYDELYLNVTGNDWDFKIDKASAKIILPEGARVLQYSGYIGVFGSTEKALAKSFSSYEVIFTSPRPLYRHEGLTVAVGFTPGVVESTVKQSSYYKFVDKIISSVYPFLSYKGFNIMLTLLFTYVYFFIMWLLFGDKNSKDTIMAEYYMPKDIGFIESAVAWHSKKMFKKSKFNMFISFIVSTVATGYTILSKNTIEYTKKPLSKDKIEDKILNEMYAASGKVSLNSYDMGLDRAYSWFSSCCRGYKEEHFKTQKKFIFFSVILNILLLFFIIPDGSATGGSLLFIVFVFIPIAILLIYLFVTAPKSSKLMVGLFLFFFLFIFYILTIIIFSVSGKFSPDYVVNMLLLLLFICSYIIFYYKMCVPDERASYVLNKLEGLRVYIDMVDKERFKIIQPSVFEENTAYAMLFGLEKKWLEAFREMHPAMALGWEEKIYPSGRQSGFAPMSKSMRSASTSPVVHRSGSSSGGFSSSGSSGSGSSGGGSGGGGGGGR